MNLNRMHMLYTKDTDVQKNTHNVYFKFVEVMIIHKQMLLIIKAPYIFLAAHLFI